MKSKWYDFDGFTASMDQDYHFQHQDMMHMYTISLIMGKRDFLTDDKQS
jgi:hypothetical protein